MYSGKWLYLCKSRIRARVALFGISVCIQTKWLFSVESGFIWAKLLYSGKSGCIQEKVAVFGQSCCILEKIFILRQSGLSVEKCLCSAKVIVFGKKTVEFGQK